MDKNIGKTYFIIFTHIVPTFMCVMFLFNIGSSSLILNNHSNVIVCIIIANIIAKSFKKASTTVSILFPESVVNTVDIRNPHMHRIAVAFFLENLNFLEKLKLNGSINANTEVIPAKKTLKKNNGPMIYDTTSIRLNISGNTMNNSPVPLVAISFNGIPLL